MSNITDIQSLERKIVAAMSQIKTNKATPTKTEVGKFLNRLKTMDEPSWEKYMAEYKIVFAEWKAKQERIEGEKEVDLDEVVDAR